MFTLAETSPPTRLAALRTAGRLARTLDRMEAMDPPEGIGQDEWSIVRRLVRQRLREMQR